MWEALIQGIFSINIQTEAMIFKSLNKIRIWVTLCLSEKITQAIQDSGLFFILFSPSVESLNNYAVIVFEASLIRNYSNTWLY